MATFSKAKTIHINVQNKHLDWVNQTKQLYTDIVSFYVSLLEMYPTIIDGNRAQAVKILEELTVSTSNREEVPHPLPFEATAMLRRSAIAKAVGFYRSHMSRWNKWNEKKKGKPPTIKKLNFDPVLYDGMYKDFDGESILLKLWNGSQLGWEWVKYKVMGGELPKNWDACSPTLKIKGGKLWLLFPVTQKIQKGQYPKKVKDQINDPSTLICSVDLNQDGHSAVCAIQTVEGTKTASLFIDGNAELQHLRKSLLGQIAQKQQQTGNINKTFCSNNWTKIKNLNNNHAHQVSRQIVDFAEEHGATVIVMEHMEKLKPSKAKYSTRKNRSLAYWLKNRIYQYVKYKAWNAGILVSRVNPRNTSRLCACCHSPVIRYNEPNKPEGYQVGGSLFLCPNGHKGHSDLNACVNIGLKLLQRFKSNLVINWFPKVASADLGTVDDTTLEQDSKYKPLPFTLQAVETSSHILLMSPTEGLINV